MEHKKHICFSYCEMCGPPKFEIQKPIIMEPVFDNPLFRATHLLETLKLFGFSSTYYNPTQFHVDFSKIDTWEYRWVKNDLALIYSALRREREQYGENKK